MVFEDVLRGRDIAIGYMQTYEIDFGRHPHTSNFLTVSLTKLNPAMPFGRGIEAKLFHGSTFTFGGLRLEGKLLNAP